MEERSEVQTTVRIFYAYAHKDEKYRKQLEKHLSVLQRQGIIAEWHDRRVVAGEDWVRSIDDHLRRSHILLLLVGYLPLALHGTVRLWETESKNGVSVLEGHTLRVETADFSFDGKYVLTGSWDGQHDCGI